MSRIRIQLWDEALALPDAWERLQRAGLEGMALQTLTEQLVIERNLRDYGLTGEFPPAVCQKLLADYLSALPEARRHGLEKEMTETPGAKTGLLNRLQAVERLKSLKLKVVPLPVVQEAFMGFKAQRENVIFQLLRVSSEGLARELYFRLHHDHLDFDHLVRTHGEGPDVPNGGLMGPIPLGKLKPELRQQLLQLTPGEMAAPLRTETDRWLIVRLLRREQLVLNADVEAQLRESLFTSWLQQQSQLARAMPATVSGAHVPSLSGELGR